MITQHILFVVTCLVLFLDRARLLENGVARTPPMGWMSWGYYMCGVNCDDYPDKCLNEQLILSVADSFFTEGYQEAGYEYIVIDDCWSEKKRDPNTGKLVADHERFPRGMKYIADYIHERGLKFGMYTNIAERTCMNYPGSKGHFAVDAATFAEWGVDYIKVDGCFVSEEYLNRAYIKLGYHLKQTGRPMVYSCSWPYYIEYIHKSQPNYTAVAAHCNMWRNYHDVVADWGAVSDVMRHYELRHGAYRRTHGPAHWHDPDMLIFGTNSLTPAQSRIHLAVYAMLSAPLLLSCDMSKITPYEKQLLQNLDLVSIGQDPLGIMARPYKLSLLLTLWVKPQLPRKGDSFPSHSLALVNLAPASERVALSPRRYGLNSTDAYVVKDVFTGKFLRNITLDDSIEIVVPAQDVVLYTLYPL